MPIPMVYPLEPVHNLPFEIRTKVLEFLQTKRSITNFQSYLKISIFHHGRIFKHFPYPDYPYLIPYFVRNYYHIPPEILCYLWYLFETYTIAFIFLYLTYVCLSQSVYCQPSSYHTLDRINEMTLMVSSHSHVTANAPSSSSEVCHHHLEESH